jgi:Flp pilus assembly protein TadD
VKRLAASALLLLCLHCAGQPSTEPPQPATDGMEPQVVALLDKARRAVVEGGDATRWGELAAAYDAHGLLEEAELCYRRAHELDPEAFDWIYLLAVVREVRGAETEELRELFAAAAGARPDYAPIQVRLGTALALRGEHAAARDAFTLAVRMMPEAAVAHRGLGQALLALGEAAAAVPSFERAVALEPADLAGHSGLAQAYMRSGQQDQAAAVVERARDLQPINVFDDPIYAERVFLRSVGSSRAFARAQVALRTGRFEQAAADLAIVVAARPDDASAHYWKGVVHRRLGQPAEAERSLTRAVELQPRLVQARVELGALLVVAGRHGAAIAQLEAADRLRPLDADGNYGLGLAYERSGRLDEARARYREAATLVPDHPAAARLAQLP